MDEFADIPKSRREKLQKEWNDSVSAGSQEGRKAGEAWARHHGTLTAMNPSVFEGGEISHEDMAEFKPAPEKVRERGLIIDAYHRGYCQGFKEGAYNAYLDLKAMVGGEE